MSGPAVAVPAVPTVLGDLLRHWRDARAKSQLGLSLDAGVSQRHISFIESGRSIPGRQTLLQLARTLDIPLRERNALLLAAGYAPIYTEAAWDAPEMQVITGVLKRMLRQHEPFPALVMDRYWNVLLTNDAAPRFFGRFFDLSMHPQPRNILQLMFDPDAMRPFIKNWSEVARSLLERVRHEAVGYVLDERTKALIASLLAYPGELHGTKTAATSSSCPVIPLSFERDGRVLNYFSMVTTVGSPQSVTAQELRVECMFPADDDTEGYHDILMNDVAD
jgi:transcriptional regulator with XRE-family HTH domain